MDDHPIASILAAVARGRGRRGWKDPAGWTRLRAQILSSLSIGHPLVWIDGLREMRAEEVTRLIGESCDAVLRGGLPSPEADAACGATWRRWCALGDVAACERLRRHG